MLLPTLAFTTKFLSTIKELFFVSPDQYMMSESQIQLKKRKNHCKEAPNLERFNYIVYRLFFF